MVKVVDWQDELRMKMMESARASNARMRKTWGGTSFATWDTNKANGALGGRPKAERAPKQRPLSDKARTVNKLLLKDLSIVEIADVLGVSRQAVGQIVERYNLPRKED